MSAEFLTSTVLLSILAAMLIAVPLWRKGAGKLAAGGAVAAVVLLPLTVLALYAQVTSYPWDNPERMTAPGPVSESEVLEMVATLAARMAEEPTIEGLSMLGRSYVTLQRYNEAVDAYHRAWEMSEGQDASIIISYAEAQIFNDRRSLVLSAGELIEQALQMAPFEPRALWYGGLSAAAKGDAETAQQRWGTLLNNPDIPDNLRQVVQQQMAAISSNAETTDSEATATSVLNVTITIDEQLAIERSPLPPTLFVFARKGGQTGGAPLAVKRLVINQFPVTLTLSDDDSMVPGTSLADHATIDVVARLSQSGSAPETSGDLYGITTTAWDSEQQAVSIVINQVAE